MNTQGYLSTLYSQKLSNKPLRHNKPEIEDQAEGDKQEDNNNDAASSHSNGSNVLDTRGSSPLIP
jgi:hypothetical protein